MTQKTRPPDIGPPEPGSSRSTTTLPLIVMAVIVVLWGLGPPASKAIDGPVLVAVLYRFSISVPIMLAVLAIRGGRLSMATLKNTALAGISFGVNLIFVFLTLREAAVAVLSVTVAMQPAFVLVVAGRFLGEHPTARHVAWAAVGMAGAAMVILGAGSEVESSALGVVLAFLSMVTFTFYFLATRQVRSKHHVDPIEWMAGVTIWSSIAVAVPTVILSSRSDYTALSGSDWLWLSVVIVFTGVAGHILMAWVHQFIEAGRSSLYILAMHPVAVGLSWPIHDEPVTIIQLLGGLVVLGAVAATIRIPARVGP